MARKSDIWYWTRNKGFYTTIRGVRTWLADGPDDKEEKGPAYQAACKRFCEIMNLELADKNGDSNTVRTICERYLDWVQHHRAKGTYHIRRYCLTRLMPGLGDIRILDLQERFVVQALARQTEDPKHLGGADKVDSPNTRRAILRSLIGALNWAAGKGGLITKNPLKGIEVPDAESRGLEVLVTPEQHQMAVDSVKGWRKDFLICLEATGCRPSELTEAEAINWRPEIGALVYPGSGRCRKDSHKHKAARTGKDRVVYFTGQSREIIERLVKERPIGKLFTLCGRARVRPKTVSSLFISLRKKLRLPHFIATSYRHTFATRALRLGWTVDMVAALLGNTPEMIRKHYGHLADDCRAMGLAMVKLRQEMAASGGTLQSSSSS